MTQPNNETVLDLLGDELVDTMKVDLKEILIIEEICNSYDLYPEDTTTNTDEK